MIKRRENIGWWQFDKSKGYFIEPTIIEATDPKYVTMCEEIFGPVLTIYVYDENKFEETLELVIPLLLMRLTVQLLHRTDMPLNWPRKTYGMLQVIFILMINQPARWLVSSHLAAQGQVELMIKPGQC